MDDSIRMEGVPCRVWGTEIDEQSIAQMERARRLPVAARAALMPDAHVGYGLPIGGVLATRDVVIPYAVGVDIACRMKMTVLDIPAADLTKKHRRDQLAKAIEEETRFGIGAKFQKKREHPVLYADWDVSPVTKYNRDKAAAQLGTSGSGNHFVEFGLLTVLEGAADLGLAEGEYVALLSHSGSRGTGAAVCEHYSDIAMGKHPDLPKEVRHLAWLHLSSEAGQEYWNAMNLMGEYAAANHACIHAAIAKHLGVDVIAGVENHHNFAWKETHVVDGREEELIVHRKGATPAGAGVLGVIPGSMATPGFVVRGRGNTESLASASHGAGRVMSRKKAKESFRLQHFKSTFQHHNITVLSAGNDEVPSVYKDIHSVMAAQADLVETLARFDPKIVKMAPEGERAED